MKRDNNFDLLRLLLAWIVVLTHASELSRTNAFHVLHPLMQSGAAVQAFFAISGCLIVASWDRTRTAKSYVRRRAQRILPAYCLAIAFCMVLGMVRTTLSLHDFFSAAATWRYLVFNLCFLNFLAPDLPGVFAHNPFGAAMDGALWTIKIEVGFYLLVPVIVWLVRRLGAAPALIGIFLLSLGYQQILQRAHHVDLAKQLPGQLMFFMVGAAVYFFHTWFVSHAPGIWAALAFLLLAYWLYPVSAIAALAIPLLTMAIAFLLPPVRGVDRFGDFSYGTYVLHFPILQLVISLGYFASHPWLALAGSSVAVAVAAFLSWHFVESRSLRAGRVKETTAVAAAA